jgi:hypothetical protein
VLTVRFAASTGLRAGERVGLRVRHLDLLRGRCEVGESATEGPLREQKFVDLRHTCASLLIAQGASVNTVQAQLGLTPRPSRTHANRGFRNDLGESRGAGADLLLVVEVGRLELPSRGVVPGILRAQPPVEVRARAVRWRRSRVLAS